MSLRLMITPLVYMMVQAVLFGIGMITILMTPLMQNALVLVPVMIVISFVVALPIAVYIAPRLEGYREMRSRKPPTVSGT
ncbi:hypothetical protein [Pleomorphomonas koreensis]|jgi:hypothetical protein|uniref:hypothetical protein n=1 Tax=Pleomorphomonas koreensis TaxID=257440 RepID=UPI0004293180|nr:hypothetical protein [Pleomorphomonas koreensis]